jgi:replicative DNA helicase
MDEPMTTPADLLPEVIEYTGDDRVVSSMEYLEIYKPIDRVTLYSGIKDLDDAVRGFQPGELIVISGPTAMGKTLLADTMIRTMRKEAHFSLLFTFEVTAETIAKEHNTPESVLFLPLQHVAMDLEWLRKRCLEAKLKYNCEAIYIDHLHYLIDMGGRLNMSLEIGRVMRFLKKEIALAMNLCVFIVCHVGKLNFEVEPSIYHIRDSSLIAQESDTVLMVWRRKDKDYTGASVDSLLQGLATIKIEKARRSGVMGKKIPIRKEGHILIQSTDEPEPETKPKAYKPRPDAPQDWRDR